MSSLSVRNLDCYRLTAAERLSAVIGNSITECKFSIRNLKTVGFPHLILLHPPLSPRLSVDWPSLLQIGGPVQIEATALDGEIGQC